MTYWEVLHGVRSHSRILRRRVTLLRRAARPLVWNCSGKTLGHYCYLCKLSQNTCIRISKAAKPYYYIEYSTQKHTRRDENVKQTRT